MLHRISNKLTVLVIRLALVLGGIGIGIGIWLIVFPPEPEDPPVIHRKHMLELFKHMQNRSRNSSELMGYPPEEVAFQRAVWYLAHARQNTALWHDLDLMNLNVPRPALEFNNPCWWVENVTRDLCPYTRNVNSVPMVDIVRREREETRMLRCLPYFYIIGQGKSGTTDLFNRLTKHPKVAPHPVQGTRWLCRTRLRENCSSFETYLNLQQMGANFIQIKHNENITNEYITGDATPDYFSYNDFWDMLPGNEGCAEPCVTNAEILYHLNPRAKIILSLRNPTDRLYSFYVSKSAELGRPVSQQFFHDLVLSEIDSFNDCLLWQSLRGCCYNYTVADSLTEKIDLRRGIYHVFLLDWMKVFPRNQIYVQSFEDYVVDKTKHLVDIFRFLSLNSPTDVALLSIIGPEEANQKEINMTVSHMMTETRDLLDRFYRPHTEQLTTMMGRSYWWNTSSASAPWARLYIGKLSSSKV